MCKRERKGIKIVQRGEKKDQKTHKMVKKLPNPHKRCQNYTKLRQNCAKAARKKVGKGTKNAKIGKNTKTPQKGGKKKSTKTCKEV